MIMKASPYIRMIFDVDLIIVNENEILFPIIAFSRPYTKSKHY